VVDGQIRFDPEQPTTIDKNQKIVNFLEIDQYMIQNAESARDKGKIKNVAEFLADENSWYLSENFERNCKDRRAT
jgi:hypothetical protein